MARSVAPRDLRPRLVPLAIGGLAALVSSMAVAWVPWLGHLELGTLQRRMVRTGAAPVSPTIMLVTIDEETPQELGINQRLPLPRSYHAALLRGLKRAGAAAVVFDLTFCESVLDEDAELRQALLDVAPMPVTLATNFTKAEADLDSPTGYRYTFRDLPVLPSPLPRYIAIGSPVAFDPNGMLDGATLLMHDSATGMTLPHVALGGVLGLFGLSVDGVRWDQARGVVEAGKRSWPVGQDGELHVQWTRAPGLFQTVPYAEALTVLAESAGRAVFSGKVVIVGVASDPGGSDIHTTPLGKVPGIEFVAQVMNTLLLSDTLAMQRWRIPANTLWAWVLGFCAIAGMRARRKTLAIVLPTGALGVAIAAPEIAQRAANVWIDTVGPCLAVVAAGGLGGLLETSHAQTLVRRFVPRHALEGRPEAVTEEATVLFVDLRGSTPLAERIGADATRDLMRKVLQALSDAIVKSGGEVERAMGDGLLTIFRAGSGEHHALRAVASIEKLRCAAEHEEWSSFGPTVNLAARIQGACGTLGESVLIGPTACAVIQDRYRVRHVRTLELRGVSGPVPVFKPCEDG